MHLSGSLATFRFSVGSIKEPPLTETRLAPKNASRNAYEAYGSMD